MFGSSFTQHELYYAVRDAARSCMGLARREAIPVGTRVLRAVERFREGVPNKSDAARTIFGGTRSNHRWSGSEPGGHLEPGRGGLYVSIDDEAFLSEVFHYSRGVTETSLARARVLTRSAARPIQETLKDKAFFLFELTTAVQAVDFTSTGLRCILPRVELDSRVRRALADSELPRSLEGILRLLPNEYSVTRALGNAAFLHGATALLVETVREEVLPLAGLNLVLAGRDGLPVPILRPLGQVAYDVVYDMRGRELRRRFL